MSSKLSLNFSLKRCFFNLTLRYLLCYFTLLFYFIYSVILFYFYLLCYFFTRYFSVRKKRERINSEGNRILEQKDENGFTLNQLRTPIYDVNTYIRWENTIHIRCLNTYIRCEHLYTM